MVKILLVSDTCIAITARVQKLIIHTLSTICTPTQSLGTLLQCYIHNIFIKPCIITKSVVKYFLAWNKTVDTFCF